MRVWAIFFVLTAGTGCAAGVKSAAAIEPTAAQKLYNDETAFLEEVEGEEALNFVRELNQKTQKEFEADPRFARFRAQFEKILEAKDRIPFAYFLGGRLYNFWQDEKHVRGIWRRTTIESYRTANPKWETVLDLDKLARVEKENWVYGGATCWPKEESRCFIRLSRGGKDADVVREFDLKTKQFVDQGYGLPEAKSETAWWDLDTALVSTDWGPGTLTKAGYPRQIRVWKRGTDHTQAPILFTAEESDVAAGIWTVHTPDESAFFFTRAIDFFNQEVFWVSPDLKEQKKLPLPTDARIIGLHKGQLLFSVRSPWSAPTPGSRTQVGEGMIAAFSLQRWIESGKLERIEVIFAPSASQAFDEVVETKDAIFVAYLDNVEGKLKRIHFDGEWKPDELVVPRHMSVGFVTASPFRSDLMIRVEGFLNPTQVLYSGDGLQLPVKIKQAPPRFNSKGMAVTQYWAQSADGTKAPYYEIAKAGSERTAAPTILYAYGGFNLSSTPWYSGGIGKVWLERGGRFVVANIRGGGEFGPRWHKAALKKNRPKAFQDFIGVAEHLIARGATTPQQLGIMGGSNGGLLVGAVAVMRPDLFEAVDCQVPLLDMLKFHLWLAGHSWKGEYGDPEIPEERKVLESYSPVHNVKPGVKYPEIFFVTSTKDDRVHPAHARKMAYVLKKADQPFYYYENIEGGHGAAANLKQRAYKSALEFVYFSRKLGLR
jgi:prolyl oligopeptidase